ncbi:MAG TPA: ABC transporter permease [Gaiellales bacterium]|nr:ABC transporter permease [Gaiellales bacterium]
MSTVAPTAGRLVRFSSRGLHRRNWVVVVCITVLVLAVVVALVGSMIAPYDPNLLNLSNAYVGPTGGHLLGFDPAGRDLLSRLLAGARTTILGPVAVVAISVGVGTGVAVAAAWLGGWFDSGISAVVDVLFAFPGILLAVLAAAVFGPSLKSAVIALSIAYTPYVARILRGAALRERAQQYVAALEVQGLTGFAICLRHLVPNVFPLIVAQATILFGYAMVDLAAISFLGLGVQTPQPDWGVMVSEGETGVLQGYPAESLAAGLAIMVVVIAVNLLGERLVDNAQRSSH